MLYMGGSHRVEVFTIGTDRHWRDIVALPSHPVIAQGTSTYCKGTLFWTVHRDCYTGTQSLVSFSLEGRVVECHSNAPVKIDSACILAELRWELCVAHLGPDGR
jgi:hypothetical protein